AAREGNDIRAIHKPCVNLLRRRICTTSAGRAAKARTKSTDNRSRSGDTNAKIDVRFRSTHPRFRRRHSRCYLHRHLHATSVAQDIQINNFAGLDVTHTVVKIQEVGYARAVNTDYQIVGLTERNGRNHRHYHHRRWKCHRGQHAHAIQNVAHWLAVRMESRGGSWSSRRDVDDKQSLNFLFRFARLYAQVYAEDG